MKLTMEEIEKQVNREECSLDLSRSYLSSRSLISTDMHILRNFLKNNPGITVLNIGWNNVGEEGAKVLSEIKTLTMLDISCNNIRDLGVKALAINNTLTTLKVRRNNIGFEGIGALAANSSIKSLDVQQNRIGDDGAKALAANTSLTALNMCDIKIGSEAVKFIAANTILTTLEINFNYIRDEGAIKLAANSTLTKLNVVCADIGNEGAKALAGNSTITALDISGNDIGATGAKALALNTTLRTLGIREIYFGYGGDRAFMSTLKNNITLVELDHSFSESKRRFSEIVNNIVTRNKIIYSYPQYAKLILASYVQKGLIETLDFFAPLSLCTLCAMSIDNTAKQQANQKQKDFKEFQTTIPDNVLVLLVNLQSLRKELVTKLDIVSLPHYGIEKYSTSINQRDKRLKF